MIHQQEKNISSLIHVSTFSKYFIPFGNFILPLLLWSGSRKESAFVDHHGKQALNFQLSLLMYAIIAGIVSIPFFVGAFPNLFEHGFPDLGRLHKLNNFNVHLRDSDILWGRILWPAGITGLIQLGLFAVNVVYSILAVVRSSEGQWFTYPISLKFIK